MATSSHRRISRKELRQPDEFMSFADRAGEFLVDNLARVIIGVVVVIAIVTAGFSIKFYESHQSRVAAEDFYQAMRSLDHKDYKAAERQFSELAHSRGNSGPGQFARFYQATTYLDQNQPAKARDVLRAFLQRVRQPTFKQMALMQLGIANEDLRDYRAAHEAYLRAAMIDGPRKQAAELGVARTLAIQGQKTEAIAAYQQFLKENPFSQERNSVIEALANLGVAPAANTVASRTIEMPPAATAPAKAQPSARTSAPASPASGTVSTEGAASSHPVTNPPR